MKEYIEREALLEEIDKATEYEGLGGCVAQAFRRYVERVPAVDAVPATAFPEIAEKATPKRLAFNSRRGLICPNCGKALWTEVDVKFLFIKRTVTVREEPNFCKHCGQALFR